MTIRQLWVRIKAILGDPESPLVRAVRAAQAEAEENAEVDMVDGALNMFMTKGG